MTFHFVEQTFITQEERCEDCNLEEALDFLREGFIGGIEEKSPGSVGMLCVRLTCFGKVKDGDNEPERCNFRLEAKAYSPAGDVVDSIFSRETAIE